MITLDNIDRRILSALQDDGSLSIAALADQLGMTPPPVWRRVRRLKEEGVLSRQVWLVDAASVGYGVTLFATVKLITHDVEATQAFRMVVQTIPEVLECYILLGSVDVLLKIVSPSIDYYESMFYSRLSQLPGVREINSSVVMTAVKDSLKMPIDLARVTASS